MELKEIEFWENHYLNEIEFFLNQELQKMLDGLKSKDKIREDWIEAFKASADKNSDFARGAERIYFWLFNHFGIPNSSPIGSDMFFETYNAFIHIDVKTAKIDNPSDYKGLIPIGPNQTSYKTTTDEYKVNLPTFYKYNNKICLTYFIQIIYSIVNDNIEIKAIYLICAPNGKLQEIYDNKIIKSGKTGKKGKGFRYQYSKSPKFKLIEDKPSRIRRIYISEDIQANEYDLIKVELQ